MKVFTPNKLIHPGVRINKQAGFTLIELVVVVVILGLLAVTAIPKFLDLTEQAEQANIEGMAGGFATGVSLVRSQWEAEARPKDGSDNNLTTYDGTLVYLTTKDDNDSSIRPGYIIGTTSSADIGDDQSLTVGNCIEIWDSLLQQPPRLASAVANINSDDGFRYLANVSGSGSSTLCHYHLKETLQRNGDGDYIIPSPLTDTGNSFTYQPSNSSVIIHINN